MLLRDNPTELVIKEYREAVLIVPAFMRRPYEMFLVLKDTSKRYLHQLSTEEITTVGEGWHDATWLIHHLMPRLGMDVAYNITAYTGPGAGIYFDFLPYTQPMGGLERIGLYICQETPDRVAESLQEALQRKST
jgi:hypothetical protein